MRRRYFELIFDTPVKQSWIYYSHLEEAQVGSRAVAEFGRTGERVGYIISEVSELPSSIKSNSLKPIWRVVDKMPLFGEEEIELSRWISAYYFCSHGEAIAAVLPSATRAAGLTAISCGDFENIAHKRLTLSAEQEAALAAITGVVGSRSNSGSGKENADKFFANSGGTGNADASGGGWKTGGRGDEEGHALSPQHYYLYGITGSGKTEVFLRAAERFLTAGMSVIYLVPEISLTQQAAEIISERFGNLAAMVHSGLSAGQRLAQWRRIRAGEARIIVGPRSAIFAPVRKLGLIIIDEEHDGSFKSGNTPRYHSRQIAMHRCAVSSATLVMGSATPSLEAWRLMNEGRIQRLDLTTRLSGGKMPDIKIVNIEHSSSCLSAELQEEIRKTALAGKQSILFLNRRGFSYFYHCKECGFELTCKRCSVSLTWHKSIGKAICHYCGYETVPPESCPNCGSLEAGFIGIGTEMVEEEVKRRFPELRVRRLDSDMIMRKDVLEETLTMFRAGAIDILLGTQMVAKGLNFAGVRLVGVIFADTGLHLPDFRAAERTFSLIVQVAGRAGRFSPDGKVLVQTLRPFDPVIRSACALDVEGFFNAELENRRLQRFPPWTRLIRIVARGKNKDRVVTAINRFFELVRPVITEDYDILGPSECSISLLSGSHRHQLLLRGENMARLHAACRSALEEYGIKKDPRVYLEVDVDPAQIL
ncbi:MAG: primosomal protein N' [Spirochaetaceae bacterium]|jgi:primosomal protein N' (replication factor Y)|nr:primosomal protein N' [Spirochaetaceae bacterium]